MKKVLTAIAALILALSLYACNEVPSGTATGTPGTTLESVQTTVEANVVTGIDLSKSELTISEGSITSITAKAIPENAENAKVSFTSSDSTVVYVDQNGNVSAVGKGSAVIIASCSSGVTAECKVTVTERDDKMDKLNYKLADPIGWFSCYGEGLYANYAQSIVFTPYLYQLEDKIQSTKAEYYAVYLRFTHLPSDKYPEKFTFNSVKVQPELDIDGRLCLTLRSKNQDSGFCPIAGETYDIEVTVVNSRNNIVLYYGTYESITASPFMESSSNYLPTPMPGFVSKNEGQYYVSYKGAAGGKVTGTTLQALYPDEKGSGVKAVANDGYTFVMWSDGLTTPERQDTVSDKDSCLTAFFIKHEDKTGIPNMYLFTESGSPVTSKDYEKAYLTIMDADDVSLNISASLQIKGRGNSSWNPYAGQENYDSKNSYRIKFDEKQQLLGIGDSEKRDWVLNSNKFDPSGLRNYLVWQLGDKMGTLPYVPDCQWVQLYINGEYRGMYMVNELVETGKDRVDVDDSINSTDKGYLIEIDFRGTEEQQPFFYVSGYGAASNDNAREFVIKSECSTADLNYIKKYVQDMHKAILTGKREEIEKYADIPSLIDMYIIEELSKDVDVGAASFFMQKDPGGKIYFTAPWDFDFGFGTYGDAVSNEGLISYDKKGCTWYAVLVEQEWFRKAVLDRMAELEGAFRETMNEVAKTAEELRKSTDKNCNFWNIYGNRYHSYISREASLHLQNYDDHINYLIDWTNARWEILKELLK